MDIRNCQINYQCPKRWDSLAPTATADVRHCTQCQRHVHYCHNKDALMQAMQNNWCVAIPLNNPTIEANPLLQNSSETDPITVTPPIWPPDEGIMMGDILWSDD